MPPAADPLAAIAPIAEEEIRLGDVPGAVILLGRQGSVRYAAAFGRRSIAPVETPMRMDAIFDLASLTKVVATTPAIMQLREAGALRLDDPVARHWPQFAAHGKAGITLRQLLTHTSGLRPDLVAADWSGADGALAAIAADHPVRPPGSAFIYSDLNFITLGRLVEIRSGRRLDDYARQAIFEPLRMRDTGFNPPAARRIRIVPTDYQEGGLRWGEVQDPTAYRMGGVAGHAGLFASAGDLARYGLMLRNGGTLEGTQILTPASVALMTTPYPLPGGGVRGLGWDMDTPYAAGLGTEFGAGSYGHTGYTGTALWIDPKRDLFLVILTSRLHPYDQGDAMPLRQRVAHLVAAALPAVRA